MSTTVDRPASPAARPAKGFFVAPTAFALLAVELWSMSTRHRPRSKTATPLESPDARLEEDVYLTIEEAAAVIRSTPAAIYQMRRRGQGRPARRPGARLLFKRAELLDWLDAQSDDHRVARSFRDAA